MEPDDIPDPLAALDQSLASCATFAKLVRAFYIGLIIEGFMPNEALYLADGYQTALIQKPAG